MDKFVVKLKGFVRRMKQIRMTASKNYY